MYTVTADVTPVPSADTACFRKHSRQIREHSQTFAGAFAHIRDTFAEVHSRIRTHSRTFAHIRAAFAHIRGFAHIRAHSRTFAHIRAHSRSGPADSQEIREHSRTGLQRFAHIHNWIRRSAVRFAHIRSGFTGIYTLIHGSHVRICGWTWSRQPSLPCAPMAHARSRRAIRACTFRHIG